MKHSAKIIALLLGMFFITQLIGIAVVGFYSPKIVQFTTESGELINKTTYDIPFGLEPPQDQKPKANFISILIAFAIAVMLMFVLMKYKSEFFLRLWFFLVVILALAVTLNVLAFKLEFSPYVALIIAIPLSFIKIFKRNFVVHNLTELAIYPGIAAIFVPLLNLWTIILLLILISIYDMYAVWHAGFMQKMAKYQIQKLKIFSGFFIPYMGQKERALVGKYRNSKSKIKGRKIKMSIALLGGGDVVFPIILAGVVLNSMGLIQALIVSVFATLALGLLFLYSQKGKFYPAMPFITAGCFIGLVITFLV
ncbi:hypothetical protein J4408_03470 [Candidatus Pacearchaeota archaeon]|nr:hypothetical protein [Candidatus Pacearchaeota archaeon]